MRLRLKRGGGEGRESVSINSFNVLSRAVLSVRITTPSPHTPPRLLIALHILLFFTLRPSKSSTKTRGRGLKKSGTFRVMDYFFFPRSLAERWSYELPLHLQNGTNHVGRKLRNQKPLGEKGAPLGSTFAGKVQTKGTLYNHIHNQPLPSLTTPYSILRTTR